MSNFDDLKRDILKAIDTLTPPNCMECSTQEVIALMAEDGRRLDIRSVASYIGQYRTEGIVTNRRYLQRNLWRLTAAGKRWLKEAEKKR